MSPGSFTLIHRLPELSHKSGVNFKAVNDDLIVC